MEINPTDFESFYDWIGEAIVFLLPVIPAAIVLGVLVGYLIAAIRNGPIEGMFVVARVIATAVTVDLPQMSARRTGAIARLAFQEALRRRVLVVFAVLAAILLFAGLFLDNRSDHPGRLYLSFVLFVTQILVLILALFLSVFSLPTDIKNRTIYTVVTKPVRASEIVLGRVLGFAGISTTILVVMCLVSYVFVVRGLSHQHQIDGELEPGLLVAQSTMDSNHRHEFSVEDDQTTTEFVSGHYHDAEIKDDQVTISSPRGHLLARVPRFGEMQFLDRDGNLAQAATNVGKEWEYRSYIEGGTLQAAIWTFRNVTEDKFPDGDIPLAVNTAVFRTHKGDIETPVRGILTIAHKDPAKNLYSEPISFVSSEFEEQIIWIPRKLKQRATGASRDVDLFNDLIEEGELQVWLQCDDRGQFFGVSQADIYIRIRDASFLLNFVKGFVAIWLQMLLVVSFGVMFSTFLSTPVALLATFVAFLLGYFKQFVEGLWTGELVGGGPLEALIRTVTQRNLTTDLPYPDIMITSIKSVDLVALTFIKAGAAALPNFSSITRMTEFVAYNYNIPNSLLARQCLTTLVYVVATSLVGYFLLKTREIAA